MPEPTMHPPHIEKKPTRQSSPNQKSLARSHNPKRLLPRRIPRCTPNVLTLQQHHTGLPHQNDLPSSPHHLTESRNKWPNCRTSLTSNPKLLSKLAPKAQSRGSRNAGIRFNGIRLNLLYNSPCPLLSLIVYDDRR